MITKLDKKDNWVQVNFRVPRGYKTALRTLAAASGLDIENLGADALGLFMGQKPLDEQEYKLAKKKMKEANIEKLCKEPPRPFDLTPTDKVKASPLTRWGSQVRNLYRAPFFQLLKSHRKFSHVQQLHYLRQTTSLDLNPTPKNGARGGS